MMRETIDTSRNQTKILVVDDEPAVADLLGQFLQTKNYQVVAAADGIEALEAVKRENPKVVLLDVHMPRMNGLKTLREIREYSQEIGVIMITSETDHGIGEYALSHGAFDYIIKPFDLNYLEKVLWWKLQLMGQCD